MFVFAYQNSQILCIKISNSLTSSNGHIADASFLCLKNSTDMLVSKLTLQTKPAVIDVTPLHHVATSPMCFYQNLSPIDIVLGDKIFHIAISGASSSV